MEPKCTLCHVQACNDAPGAKRPPRICPILTEPELLARIKQTYMEDNEDRRLALASARVEAAGYCRWPRVEEIMAFARELGVNRIGIANCVGLIQEARILQEILEANGFEVVSVCCKVGAIPKREVGLRDEDMVPPGSEDVLCNPVAQAELLNQAGTGLNVVVGLCVGHDSLFFRHAQAPVTVLVAKDRVTGHNPVAALYTSHSYYKRLRQPHQGR